MSYFPTDDGAGLSWDFLALEPSDTPAQRRLSAPVESKSADRQSFINRFGSYYGIGDDLFGGSDPVVSRTPRGGAGASAGPRSASLNAPPGHPEGPQLPLSSTFTAFDGMDAMWGFSTFPLSEIALRSAAKQQPQPPSQKRSAKGQQPQQPPQQQRRSLQRQQSNQQSSYSQPSYVRRYNEGGYPDSNTSSESLGADLEDELGFLSSRHGSRQAAGILVDDTDNEIPLAHSLRDSQNESGAGRQNNSRGQPPHPRDPSPAPAAPTSFSEGNADDNDEDGETEEVAPGFYDITEDMIVHDERLLEEGGMAPEPVEVVSASVSWESLPPMAEAPMDEEDESQEFVHNMFTDNRILSLVVVAEAGDVAPQTERAPLPDPKVEYPTTPLLAPLKEVREESAPPVRSEMLNDEANAGSYEADEVVKVGYASGKAVLDSAILEVIRAHFFNGHNAMLTISSTQRCGALGEDCVSTMISTVFDQASGMGTNFENELSISAFCLCAQGRVVNLLPTQPREAEEEPIKLATNPIVGSCISNYPPIHIRSRSEAIYLGRALVKNARTLGVDPFTSPETMLWVMLHLKQTRHHGLNLSKHSLRDDRNPFVYLSSLQLLFLGSNFERLDTIINEEPVDTWPLFRQAFGGQSRTAFMAFIDADDDDLHARRALEYSQYFRTFENQPPRSGSVRKFLESTATAAKEELRRNIMTIEQMRRDALQLLEDPRAEPTVYPIAVYGDADEEVTRRPYGYASHVLILSTPSQAAQRQPASGNVTDSSQQYSEERRSSRVSKKQAAQEAFPSVPPSQPLQPPEGGSNTPSPPLPQPQPAPQQQQQQQKGQQRPQQSPKPAPDANPTSPQGSVPSKQPSVRAVGSRRSGAGRRPGSSRSGSKQGGGGGRRSRRSSRARRPLTDAVSESLVQVTMPSDVRIRERDATAVASMRRALQRSSIERWPTLRISRRNTAFSRGGSRMTRSNDGASNEDPEANRERNHIAALVLLYANEAKGNGEAVDSNAVVSMTDGHTVTLVMPQKGNSKSRPTCRFEVDEVRQANNIAKRNELVHSFSAIQRLKDAFVDDRDNVALLYADYGEGLPAFEYMPVWNVLVRATSDLLAVHAQQQQDDMDTYSQAFVTLFGGVLRGRSMVRDLATMGTPTDDAEGDATVGKSPLFGGMLYGLRGVNISRPREVEPLMMAMIRLADSLVGDDPEAYLVFMIVQKIQFTLDPARKAQLGKSEYVLDGDFASYTVVVTRNSMRLYEDAESRKTQTFPFGLFDDIIRGPCRSVSLLNVDRLKTQPSPALSAFVVQHRLMQVVNPSPRVGRVSTYVYECLQLVATCRHMLQEEDGQHLDAEKRTEIEQRAEKYEQLAAQHEPFLLGDGFAGFVIFSAMTEINHPSSLLADYAAAAANEEASRRDATANSPGSQQPTPPQKSSRRKMSRNSASRGAERSRDSQAASRESPRSAGHPSSGEGGGQRHSHSNRRRQSTEDGVAGEEDKSTQAPLSMSAHPITAEEGVTSHSLLLFAHTRKVPPSNEHFDIRSAARGELVVSSPKDGRQPSFHFDEIVELSRGGGKSGPNTTSLHASQLINTAVGSFLSGINASFVVQETAAAAAAQVVERMLQLITRGCLARRPRDVEIFFSAAFVDDCECVDLLGEEMQLRVQSARGSATKLKRLRVPLTMGFSPLAGSFVSAAQLRPQWSEDDVQNSLTAALRADRAIAGGNEHVLALTLWQKMVVEAEGDVSLSSLSIIVMRDSPSAIRRYLRHTTQSPFRAMLRYALGGACYTVCCAVITDDEVDATDAKDKSSLDHMLAYQQNSLSAIAGKPAIYGSYSEMLKFHRQRLAAMQAELKEFDAKRLKMEEDGVEEDDEHRAEAEKHRQKMTGRIQLFAKMAKDEEKMLAHPNQQAIVPPYYDCEGAA